MVRVDIDVVRKDGSRAGHSSGVLTGLGIAARSSRGKRKRKEGRPRRCKPRRWLSMSIDAGWKYKDEVRMRSSTTVVGGIAG